jgi:hypothetical protein
MTKAPLLSIVTTNKNDEYHKDQLQQIKFIINYLTHSLKKMDALNKVEYVIVDWGSNEPLSNYFYEEISKCSAIKFINVPEEETKKCNLSFDQSKALNIGIKNSSGEHIMITGSDQFFPLSVFNNIINLLEKPELFGITNEEYKLVPRKQLKDDFFIYDNNMDKNDQYFQGLSQSMLTSHDFQMNDGSGAGGHMLKKKQWLKIGGVKDSNKHNRGQDLVIFHETSEICTHIDTATFGSYLLKLPRTKSILRQSKMEKVKNPMDYLQFERDDSVINSNNIEIISNLNLPQKKLDFEIQSSFEKNDRITIIEMVKATIECSLFTIFSKINLKSQDIQFILKLKTIIKTLKLNNIILDEKQAKRFILYLAKSFPHITLHVITDPRKNTPLELTKLRNAFAIRMKLYGHYGNLKFTNFNFFNFTSLNKFQDCCIIQDFSSDTIKLPFFKEKLSSTKINAVRILKNNTKILTYNIEGEFSYEQKNSKILRSNVFINLLIYSLKVFFKSKRILGNIKRRLKN